MTRQRWAHHTIDHKHATLACTVATLSPWAGYCSIAFVCEGIYQYPMFWVNVRPPANEWLGDSTGATTLALTSRTPRVVRCQRGSRIYKIFAVPPSVAPSIDGLTCLVIADVLRVHPGIPVHLGHGHLERQSSRKSSKNTQVAQPSAVHTLQTVKKNKKNGARFLCRHSM